MGLEEVKTPAIVVQTPPPLPASDGATPSPRRLPPSGRPPGAISVAELRERITTDITRATMVELERTRAALRAQLAAEARWGLILGFASLALNVVAVLVIVVVARATHGWLADVTVAALAVVAIA